MKTRQEILNHLITLIEEENGTSVSAKDTVLDSGIDSLGKVFLLVELDDAYGILEGVPIGEEVEKLGLDTMTIKDLVNLCKKSLITKSATE